MTEQSREHRDKVESWNVRISSISATGRIVQTNLERQTKDINHHADQNTKEIKQAISSSSGRKNVFRPQFLKESNPPNVLLNFDDEETYEGRLKRAFLNHNHDPDGKIIASATGKQVKGADGMGGVGKSCALRGLTEDADVKKFYSGGIYFISLGMDADLKEVTCGLEDIVRSSGGTEEAKTLKRIIDGISSRSTKAKLEKQVERCLKVAALWFSNCGDCPCLFLVDDIWLRNGITSTVVQSLSELTQCHPHISLCFATRFTELGVLAGDKGMVSFDTLPPQGVRERQILLSHAGVYEVDVPNEHQESLEKVLDIAAGLNVALAVVGGSVRVLREKMSGGGASNAQLLGRVFEAA